MHISDGVLSPSFVVGTYVGGAALISYSYKNTTPKEIVKSSFFTAIFFFASFIKIPLAFISVHLVLNSVIGIVLKRSAPIAFLIALFFQAIFFANGGISALGANVIVMSSGAFLANYIYTRYENKISNTKLYFLAGFSSIICSSATLCIVLLGSYASLKEIIIAVFASNIILATVEGIMMVYILRFMKKRYLL